MRSVRLLVLVSLALTLGARAALSASIPQSPVNFQDAGMMMGAAPKILFGGYNNNQLTWENTTTRSGMGKTESIKTTPKAASPIPTVNFENLEYKLKDIHFHIHSEHTRNGLIYPMEMHIVHEHVDAQMKSKFLAIGRWILEGGPDANPLKPIFDNLPAVPPLGQPPAKLNVPGFVLSSLVPADKSLYRYEGSLTTGLVVETEAPMMGQPDMRGQLVSKTPVSWVMFKDPLLMPRTQVDKYRAHFQNGNWRETQAIVNDHMLKMGTAVPEPSTACLFAVGAFLAARRMRAERGRAGCGGEPLTP